MKRHSASRSIRATIVAAITLAAVALPSLAAAQATGRGYLFARPNASFSMRAGYEAVNTEGDPFNVIKRETTIGPRSLDAFNFGVDFNVILTNHVDIVMTADLSSRSTTAEYRGWEENGRPITHVTSLDRGGLGAGVRYNLLPRGRQISSLAWIPSRTVPYVGAAGGLMWYEFRQNGDFVEEVDESTGNIFTDDLRSRDVGFMGQAFAGVEQRLNARWSLIGETRYTQASASLTKDYRDFHSDINLSGLAFNIGASVRF